eukprot:TRINITY_DN11166_c0_g1_i1.p1 TRINITY_DN11166_c0_g1~~TRINITY_DN11166_c0_g1_i1.p1  ORF type:complete len:391 (-),score=114.55 TRINITY_DN11166_c0_g1_i1:107-1114(-)
MSEPPTKKQKMSKVIGTHSGNFHCDEALGIYLLRVLPEYKDATLVRSRDAATWETCDVLIDVGDVYDPARHRYDHHQRGFFETLSPEHEIKLSSAGLVYKHFGERIIKTLYPDISDENLKITFLKLYKNFVAAIDAIDNGVKKYDTTEPEKGRYSVNTDLSARVGFLNPSWNETDKDLDVEFEKASTLAGTEFVRALSSIVDSWLPAREVVLKSIAERKTHDESGSILLLSQVCPWKGHLTDIEEEQGLGDSIKVVVYEGGPNNWRVQSVPLTPGSFDNRAPLPEPWRGQRGEELSKIAGIEGCVFAHNSGFIGGNTSFEGVMKMAKASLAALEE